MVNTNVESSPANISHLLRRAGWGGTPADIERGVEEGIEATVAGLLDPSTAPPAGDAHRTDGLEAYSRADFVVWWYHLAVTSPAPGLERLAWFWHGHFATSFAKVRFPSLLRNQLVSLRRHATGRFDDLLELMSHDAAMNLWLDLHTSIVGQPNENFARELMELFSLGVDGGYTQSDVGEAGRAFTGYGLALDPSARFRPVGTELRPALHDYGTKTVLGVTGELTGRDVIAAIVDRPECHRFVARRFWSRYAGTVAPDTVVDQLAASFAERLSVADLLTSMLSSEAFYTSDVKAGLVAQPVETLVRTLRNFELPVPDLGDISFEDTSGQMRARAAGLLEISRLLGQVPGAPPNVGGWPHNEGWLATDTAAGRLIAGTALGAIVAEAETDLSEELRSLAPDELAERMIRQFGLVEWSEATFKAAETAAGSERSSAAAVKATFALVFTSPEVTLS
ncbi:MAG: DUF1800 domain-containing protein [Actinomycetia bacterium]|nr:DUF1800 domain-containing protein [Actinomycetes bacterium]MCP4962094.1 DUF1800 domain-containing protein [Actinomycetes bacterium]